jgi:alpha-beta hydrolase superfamily lysophospholipase
VPDDLELAILNVAVREGEGGYEVILRTTRGDISGALAVHEGGDGAALFVSGAMGGVTGPAFGVYERLAAALAGRGVTSLRIDYRKPGVFNECVLDALGGASFLRGIGARRLVIVGHSFGGAVAIRVGELADGVVAVAALSSQLSGAEYVDRLSPKPLLLVHGGADDILDDEASQLIYERALEPKRLVIYPETGHGLAESAEEVYTLLLDWIAEQLPPAD